MNTELKYVSNNIKSQRVKNGLLQSDIAIMLGVSRTTYCDYEVNPQKVKIETFQKLADLLNCKLSDFFVENKDTKSDIST